MEISKEMLDAAEAALDAFPYDTLPEGWIHRAVAEVAITAALLHSVQAQGRRIAETRAAALEEAANLIQATADEHSTKGRDLRGGYSDRRFYAVMGARLNESAAAIRALIPREG